MSIKLNIFEKSSDFGYYQAGEIIKQIRQFQKQKLDEMFRLGISYGSANNLVVNALVNLFYANRENGLGINFDNLRLVCTEALWPDTAQIKGLPGYEFLQNVRQLETDKPISAGVEGVAKKYKESGLRIPVYFMSLGYRLYIENSTIITTIRKNKAEGLKRILETTFDNPKFDSFDDRLKYLKTREFRNVPSVAIITRGKERQGRDTVICTDTAGASKCLQIPTDKLTEWGVEIIHNPPLEFEIPTEERFNMTEIFDYYKELHGEERKFGGVR